jgi:hypothetical protein
MSLDPQPRLVGIQNMADLPTFAGNLSDNPEEFLDELESRLRLKAVSQTLWVDAAMACLPLATQAGKWRKSHANQLRLLSYTAFSAAFVARFTLHDTAEDALRKFLDLRRPSSEPLADFAVRFELALNDCKKRPEFEIEFLTLKSSMGDEACLQELIAHHSKTPFPTIHHATAHIVTWCKHRRHARDLSKPTAPSTSINAVAFQESHHQPHDHSHNNPHDHSHAFINPVGPYNTHRNPTYPNSHHSHPRTQPSPSQGRSSSRGRSPGRANSKSPGIRCYNCSGNGHIARECPLPRRPPTPDSQRPHHHTHRSHAAHPHQRRPPSRPRPHTPSHISALAADWYSFNVSPHEGVPDQHQQHRLGMQPYSHAYAHNPYSHDPYDPGQPPLSLESGSGSGPALPL